MYQQRQRERTRVLTYDCEMKFDDGGVKTYRWVWDSIQAGVAQDIHQQREREAEFAREYVHTSVE